MLGAMTPMSLFWLTAMIIFAVVEGLTVGLVSIWFAAGALAALISSALGAPVWLQLVLFFVVTIALLLLLRPFSRSRLFPKNTPTNADRNIGKKALVTETIDNLTGKGAVKIDGLTWSARSTSGAVIDEGRLVVIERIEGVKLLVSLPEAAE